MIPFKPPAPSIRAFLPPEPEPDRELPNRQRIALALAKAKAIFDALPPGDCSLLGYVALQIETASHNLNACMRQLHDPS